jgi:hypothetical protein
MSAAVIPGITVSDAFEEEHSVPIMEFMDRIDEDMLNYRRAMWRSLCREDKWLNRQPIAAHSDEAD